MNENYNLTADQYADMFSDFYTENEATYGENMEEAYADFEEALNAEVEAEQFEAYYSETKDLYEDTEEGMEEAYADFQAFQTEGQKETEETEEEYSDEDQAFLDFYSQTQDIYGDNIEEAYADFVEFTNEDQEDEDENEVEETEEEYSAEDFDNDFMDFFSEAKDLYKGNVEEAFSAFEELMDSEYGIKDVASKIGTSIKKAGSKAFDKTQKFIHTYIAEPGAAGKSVHHGANYSDEDEETEDEYGMVDGIKKVGKAIKTAGSKAFNKTQKFIHTHIAEPGAAGNAVHHGARYSDEEETEEEVYSDEELDYLTLDEFSEGFAEFYSEMEDVYGEEDADLEEAYDDYADLVAEQELELMFSEDDSDESETEDTEYGFMDKAKELGAKAKGLAGKAAGNKTVKAAGIGAGAGLAAGLIAGSVGKDAKERRALKAKGAGRTAAETARYNDLKKSRRNKIAGGALVGAGAGAAVANKDLLKNKVKALGSGKSGLALAEKNNSAEDTKVTEVEEKEFSAEDTKVTEVEEKEVKEVSKEKSFSAVDLLGKPGLFNLGSTKSAKTEDKTFSSSDKGAVKISTGILGILGR